MWLPRSVHEETSEARLRAEAVRDALIKHNIQLTAHMEWMRIRMTQLELERAALLKRYLGVDVPVPTFEQTAPPVDPNETIDFHDIGDAMADKLGISWGPDGTLTYAK